MINNIYHSVCYVIIRWFRPVACLALLHLLPAPGLADAIHQWTDAAGIAHFSDTPPAHGLRAHRHEVEPVPARTQPAQGLRPGEMASLQAIEQRLKDQHRRTQRLRQRNGRVLAERRSDCRERRARQRRTGNHPARKELTTYLRRNCW